MRKRKDSDLPEDDWDPSPCAIVLNVLPILATTKAVCLNSPIPLLGGPEWHVEECSSASVMTRALRGGCTPSSWFPLTPPWLSRSNGMRPCDAIGVVGVLAEISSAVILGGSGRAFSVGCVVDGNEI